MMLRQCSLVQIGLYLLQTLSVIIITVDAEFKFSKSNQNLNLRGKIKHSLSSSTYQTRSRIHCGVKCSEMQCLSYFYQSTGKECQINADDFDMFGGSYQTGVGWQLYIQSGIINLYMLKC